MKLTNLAHLLLVASLLSLTAVGCKKKPQGVTPLPGRQGGIMGEGPRGLDATGVTGTGVEGTGIPLSGEVSNWQPAAEQPFKADTVYFDFDRSNIKASEVHKIQTVADGMKSYAGKALRIEGHCDERGTEEYNRSLGERRALSVREALVRAGLDPRFIDTRSYGEDRPAAPGHNEAAWSKNRRGEFILLTPP
jgi:peptidoglycan-associated lipoprotein